MVVTKTAADRLEWRVGAVRIVRVAEWVGAVPHGAVLPGMVPELVDAQRPWIDPFVAEDGRMLLSVHSFVVQSGDTTIVVDTCVGAHGERPLPHDDAFPEVLAAEVDGGLDGVDVVLCTHLHFDHVGWNTVATGDGDVRPTFPNARYLVSETELATYADHDHEGIGSVSVEPLRIAGCLRGVESDHRITSEVRLTPTPGHTAGHVSVAIESGGRSAIITGDAFHNPIQFPHPELGADRFDADSPGAATTRRRLISELIDSDTLVLGTHFAPPTAGVLVTGPGGRGELRPLQEEGISG